MNLSNISREEINDAFERTYIKISEIPSIDMNRAELQFIYARKIIDAYAEGRENVIMSAPTGFGKSLLAFILTNFFNLLDSENTSYLLTSNKFLQSQYQKDIKLFELTDHVMLKGQSNYECTENKLNFKERKCKDNSIASVESGKAGFACSKTCPYIVTRRAAINSSAAIFNYSYWLTIMNNQTPASVFEPRTFTVFDECHVLGNIVQDMFAVEFNINQFIRRTTVAFNVLNNRIGHNGDMQVTRFAKLVELFTRLRQHQEDNVASYEVLIEFSEEIVDIKNQYYELIKELVKLLKKNDAGVPIGEKYEMDMIAYMGTIIEIVMNLGQLLETYKEIGKESMVVDFKNNDIKYHKPVEEFNNLTNFTLVLQCTNESELIKKAVITHTQYGLFMSATIGHIDDYATQSGIDNYYGIEVPQVFDYAESPIYNVIPMISMSYQDKARNMPTMIDRILKVIDANPDERGLVHTGNFEIMKELAARNHPRIMTYSNSAEKEDMVKLLSSRPDIVIAGPSLIEGVDLKDDLCRFMIFAKVPYKSLADKLTKRKIEVYKNWYNWLTLSNILQGLGRGIRNDKDWCKSYFLDAGFLSFFSRYAPPLYIRQRFKDTKHDSINTPVHVMSDDEFDAMIMNQ